MKAQAEVQSGCCSRPGLAGSLTGCLIGLTLSPRRWFSDAFPITAPRAAAGLLLLSSLFYATAGSLTALSRGNVIPGAILLINALGMTVLSAAMTWMLACLFNRQPIGFGLVLKVFSVAAAPVLLIAWVPGAFFFSEPWKWLLIALGLIHGLGISGQRALWIVLSAAALTAAGFLAVLKLMGAA